MLVSDNMSHDSDNTGVRTIKRNVLPHYARRVPAYDRYSPGHVAIAAAAPLYTGPQVHIHEQRYVVSEQRDVDPPLHTCICQRHGTQTKFQAWRAAHRLLSACTAPSTVTLCSAQAHSHATIITRRQWCSSDALGCNYAHIPCTHGCQLAAADQPAAARMLPIGCQCSERLSKCRLGLAAAHVAPAICAAA
jgi:hypothetical protein